MHIYPVTPDEAFDWSDKFSKVSGLSTADSMLILAEFAYFHTSSRLLSELIDKEEASSYDFDFDDNMLRFNFDAISDEDRSGIEAHYQAVLEWHEFTPEFSSFFFNHLSPTKELAPVIPQFDPEQVFCDEFWGEPFFDYDPSLDSADEDEDEPSYIEDALRMAIVPNPTGWIAIAEHLGFKIKEGSVNIDREWDTPAFVIIENGVDYPVFVLHPAKSPYDDEDVLCNNLKHHIEVSFPLNTIIFWNSPMLAGSEPDERCISFWGEVLIDDRWLPLSLRPDSTSFGKIREDAKLLQHGITEESFNVLGTLDRSLFKVWRDNHIDMISEMFSKMPKPRL